MVRVETPSLQVLIHHLPQTRDHPPSKSRWFFPQVRRDWGINHVKHNPKKERRIDCRLDGFSLISEFQNAGIVTARTKVSKTAVVIPNPSKPVSNTVVRGDRLPATVLPRNTEL